jgi:hypothetical protein
MKAWVYAGTKFTAGYLVLVVKAPTVERAMRLVQDKIQAMGWYGGDRLDAEDLQEMDLDEGVEILFEE